jgi:Protein of unknown function (DUF3455)
MKNHNTRGQRTTRASLLVSYVTALGITLAVALPQAAHADSVLPPPVPTNLNVPAPNEAFFVGHATGTQNYVCLPSPTIGKVAWTLFTPQATLFDDEGEQRITHFFSPNPSEGVTVRATWEDSDDTSTVWGRVLASSSDASFVTPGAIPWLLVEVVGAKAGPTGGSAISGTTFIQRVNTVGGAAPSTGCSLPNDIGNRAYVPYTADYFFYQKSN